jgi:hypothetical protein
MVFRVQTDRLGPWWLPKRASTLQEETSKVNFHASEAVKSRPKKNQVFGSESLAFWAFADQFR